MSEYRTRLHRSHASSHLRDELIEALEAPLGDTCPWWSRFAAGKQHAYWIIGQLWNCTDTVPGSICHECDIPVGSTYASLVRKLRSSL
jgi:hypothetical protein